jgi:hypothetical protein
MWIVIQEDTKEGREHFVRHERRWVETEMGEHLLNTGRALPLAPSIVELFESRAADEAPRAEAVTLQIQSGTLGFSDTMRG